MALEVGAGGVDIPDRPLNQYPVRYVRVSHPPPPRRIQCKPARNLSINIRFHFNALK